MRLRALIGKFRSPQAVFTAPLNALCEVEGIDRITAEKIRNSADDGFAEQQLALAEKCQARILTYWDAEYPERLKQIYDPPVFLFVRGELRQDDKYAIALVGTRMPSSYGRMVAEKLSEGLARKGITVVSGLARGIDTLCHLGALKAGGRTLAVLGSGVDVIYPPENRKLAEKIVAQGALVSEFPMGADPDAPNFPRRNRLISGLSLGVIVIEAGERSGALITAETALEQGREVLAVPGNITSPKSQGPNRLIQEGAALVRSVEDVFSLLDSELRPLLHAGPQPKEITLPLTPEEKRVLEALSHEARHIDTIAQANGMPTSQVLAILLSLELKDLVKQLPGKMFVRL